MGMSHVRKHLRPSSWWLFGATLALVAWTWRNEVPSQQEAQRIDRNEARAAWLEGLSESPRTLVVDFRDDVTDEQLATNAYVEEPVSRLSQDDKLFRVRFGSTPALLAALDVLEADPTVESVDFDVSATLPGYQAALGQDGDRGLHHLAPPGLQACGEPAGKAARPGFPDDPCFRYQWHLAQIGAQKAWKQGQGQGVVVAVIDTGISRVGDLANTTFVPGYNFVDDKPDAQDDHGHGTHVAGTIAQSTHNGIGVAGVAFKASLMPLKVLSARGSGSMAAIAQAIRWAADHGANVVNMSLGGPFPVNAIHNAVKYARSKGVIVVAAAGNDGRGRVSYPGRYADVVAVAATQFDENATFYSNWGKTIDLAAPGGNVRVDQNGDGQPDGVLQNTVVPGQTHKQDYLWFMGTSMASPHVAGVAALLVGAGITQPDAVETLLLTTARVPKSQAGKATQGQRIDDHYGAGIVDADAALARARAGREGGALALGATLALAMTGSLRRRHRLARGGRLKLVAGLVLGSSGLFVLPGVLGFLGLATPAVLAPLTSGLPLGLSTWLGAVLGRSGHGNPLLMSAALPVLAIALGYGIKMWRPALAGFALGTAGLLFTLAVSGLVDVTWVPDSFDQIFLLVNAAIASVMALLTLLED